MLGKIDIHHLSFISASIFLIVLYVTLCGSVIISLRLNPVLRRLSSYFVLAVFGLIILFFALQCLLSPGDALLDHNLMMIFLGVIPAGLFVFLRRETAMLSHVKNKSEERFDQLKDEFLTVASHELRTPLSVINGFAEILALCKLGPLNDEQKRRVRKILMQSQRLSRIIDELLDMSRIRSGRLEVKSEVFDLVPVLKACLDDHKIIAEQQNIELFDEIPDVLPDVVGDLERVTQVIVNLLSNAMKYTLEDGKVRLTASFDDKDKQVRVTVIDTGIGIDPKYQAQVFDEFFRVTSQTGGKFKGTGLGLAIVNQLVAAMKGKVGVQSQGVGQGSTFFFTLPIAKELDKVVDLPKIVSRTKSVA